MERKIIKFTIDENTYDLNIDPQSREAKRTWNETYLWNYIGRSWEKTKDIRAAFYAYTEQKLQLSK